ncbi:uncharacterized protein LY89DRAFT_781193 [Mollisia scopiformis]|uniref:Uncharacterized protein n=1 Tax=Mollisia scopiformis TaxID=149040 RepID=A0A194XD65_MOLSC|nr:uncharacterized protein LY89DRAFT_781193 [Mollisia scopiformis]KUJ18099.1 hypothetical protein LY89DRAFT_781193 [Mollisia scopiformis]
MNQTTARLRKTFHYPHDNSSSDSLPEALDEEEQENLIHTLTTQNAMTNTLYRHVLLALPLLSILPYLPSLFLPPPQTALLSLLAVTSLLSTAYLLNSLPPESTGFQFLDALNRGTGTGKGRERGRDEGGPVKRYLPWLNLGLCAVVAVAGLGGKGEWVGFGWVPGCVLGVVVVGKWVMGGVDPEGELGGLRYGFKGA